MLEREANRATAKEADDEKQHNVRLGGLVSLEASFFQGGTVLEPDVSDLVEIR